MLQDFVHMNTQTNKSEKMYVTRRLSQVLKSPEILTEQPSSHGPNSGFLVIQDEKSETYTCCGCCKKRTLKNLPFPQNKELLIRYTSFVVDKVEVSEHPVFFIHVLNQPLSSNHYYAIVPHGKHKGKAFTCSHEEDKVTGCFCRRVKDVNPRPLDLHNINQQFQIAPHQPFLASKRSFFATSITWGGFPPYFVRRGGWTINTKTPRNFKLDTAKGLDSILRARLPEFNISLSQYSSQPLVVGKWYSPFMFVKERTLKDQVKRSMYYEVTLEQRWEKIFACGKYNNNTEVAIEVVLENEEVLVGGTSGEWDEKTVVDGVIWFKSNGSGKGRGSVGLRVEIVERMKWEQARGGWVKGDDDRLVNINKVEKVEQGVGWSEFGCYALVERFNFRRMDGSLVMSYDFKYFHKLKTRWE